MSHVALFWILTILNLAIAVRLLRMRKEARLTRALCGGGALLLGLGALCNTLVITANGGRMPVEPVDDWKRAPEFLSGPGKEGPLRSAVKTALLVESEMQPAGIHADVGSTGSSIRQPRLAWLDDRYPVIVCDFQIVYSLGDVLIAGGLTTALPSTIVSLLVLGLRFRRMKKRPQT